MSKNVILAVQVVLSGIFLFLAYGGQVKPHVSLLSASIICVSLILASRILLKRNSFIWAGVVIAVHVIFLVILPLNS